MVKFKINFNFQIQRCDVIEDCGKSSNPFVDIGQIEGSIMMGYGLFTCEMVKYNHDTGEKLINVIFVKLIKKIYLFIYLF